MTKALLIGFFFLLTGFLFGNFYYNFNKKERLRVEKESIMNRWGEMKRIQKVRSFTKEEEDEFNTLKLKIEKNLPSWLMEDFGGRF